MPFITGVNKRLLIMKTSIPVLGHTATLIFTSNPLTANLNSIGLVERWSPSAMPQERRSYDKSPRVCVGRYSLSALEV